MKTLGARKKSETVLIMLGTIFALSLLIACKEGTKKSTGDRDRIEEARITSPDGRFDAVMTRGPVGGVLGGVYWNVFIVSKGAPAPKGDDGTILDADVFRGEKLVWKQNHLLEIHYDIGHIEQFRNLWGSNELEGRGWRKGDYLVEARLVPSSSDFSFITPDGQFKPRE